METFANKQNLSIKQWAAVSNNTAFHIEGQQNKVECIFYQVSNNFQSATWLVVLARSVTWDGKLDTTCSVFILLWHTGYWVPVIEMVFVPVSVHMRMCLRV